jgi:SAM-dependent methyltransferase
VIEFTGERVVPGQVEEDLWGEHMARYAFAARFATAARVLDLGCGTGYGTAELGRRASEAVGVDVAPEAIAYASANYRAAKFIASPATDTPFSDQSFDLVTSFELIEHLPDWRPLVAEAKRVLHPTGMFVVSTPNKLYYAESRGESGPNPFHEHEFEYAEFRDALLEYFPHVQVLLQDRLQSFAIYAPGKAGDPEAKIARATEDATTANFFVAVCSQEPLPELRPYLYVPRAANVLRERELHVEQLEKQLAEMTASRDGFIERAKLLEAENEEKTAWANGLADTLKGAQARVAELQHANEVQRAQAAATLEALNAENLKNATWALELDKTLAETTARLTKVSAKLDVLRVKVEAVRQSKWYKLGRHLGLGPKVD